MKKSVTTMNEIDTNDVFFDTEKKNQSDLGLKVIHQKPIINTNSATTAM